MAGSAPILLLSMPQMADPNFARTVVLLCDYTDEGAFGLVVNRQMEEPAWTLIKTEPPVRVDPDLAKHRRYGRALWRFYDSSIAGLVALIILLFAIVGMSTVVAWLH